MFESSLCITICRTLNLLPLLCLTKACSSVVFTPLRWINFVEGSFLLLCSRMKTVTMLRRRSEFFVFLDSVRSVKPEKEEQKEEDHLSPYEEYLQVLLQMKMTSAVSGQKWFPFRHTVSLLKLEQQ